MKVKVGDVLEYRDSIAVPKTRYSVLEAQEDKTYCRIVMISHPEMGDHDDFAFSYSSLDEHFRLLTTSTTSIEETF